MGRQQVTHALTASANLEGKGNLSVFNPLFHWPVHTFISSRQVGAAMRVAQLEDVFTSTLQSKPSRRGKETV